MNNVSPNAQALGKTIAGLLVAPTQLATAFASGLATRSQDCGCHIPPPCWEPRNVGTCRLTLGPGSVGAIRLHLTNCQWTRQVFMVTVLGKLAGWVNFAPTTLIVGPQETANILVNVQVPTSLKLGQSLSGPLIIRGCLDHFARIEVVVADCSGTCACDIVVKDCQDHVHHWYDHFYCYRPCTNSLSTRGVVNG